MRRASLERLCRSRSFKEVLVGTFILSTEDFSGGRSLRCCWLWPCSRFFRPLQVHAQGMHVFPLRLQRRHPGEPPSAEGCRQMPRMHAKRRFPPFWRRLSCRRLRSGWSAYLSVLPLWQLLRVQGLHHWRAFAGIWHYAAASHATYLTISVAMQASKTFLEMHVDSFAGMPRDTLILQGLLSLKASLQSGELDASNCTVAVVGKDHVSLRALCNFCGAASDYFFCSLSRFMTALPCNSSSTLWMLRKWRCDSRMNVRPLNALIHISEGRCRQCNGSVIKAVLC
jgi:hypothetical protein